MPSKDRSGRERRQHVLLGLERRAVLVGTAHDVGDICHAGVLEQSTHDRHARLITGDTLSRTQKHKVERS